MAQNARVYQDFVPTTEWVRDAEHDTLLIYLRGFRKEQLRVQVTTDRNLRISGERPVGDKWSRFRKEFNIPLDYDTNKISARFENGILKIKHMKLTKSETDQNANNFPPKKENNKQKDEKKEENQPEAQAKKKEEIQPEAPEIPAKVKPGNDSGNVISDSQKIPDKEQAVGKSYDGKKIPEKNSEEKGKFQEVCASSKSKFLNYKQALGNLVTRIKIPGKRTNLVLAVGLLVLILGLLVNKVIRSE